MYELSEPIEEEKYKVFLDELKELCAFHKIEVPEVRVTSFYGVTMGADSINNRIYVNSAFIEEVPNQKYLAYLAMHEIAHILLGHRGSQPKQMEYIVDRIAAAMVENKEQYAESLRFQEKWVANAENPYRKMINDRKGLAGVLSRFNRKLLDRKKRKMYGTFEERIANLRLDEPHPGRRK